MLNMVKLFVLVLCELVVFLEITARPASIQFMLGAYLGALLQFGFFQGSQGILESIVNGWLSKTGWHVVVFHNGD